ncbi:hypothetical protein L208DRAFT_1390229 [Tricholoma matsutake]|nr:hypothetical protein L208DRAFT_1390229 [Tricholoma matsutake 945]
MVLSKRKRTGEFVTWTPPGQAPTKKARSKQVQEDTHIPTTSSYPTLSNTTQSYTPTMPSEPPLKKLRKKTDPNAPQPEKRAAIFKKKCPQNILDRVERVMTQRFFMIDRQRTPGELREEFSVLGSTGNVYTVIIDRRPSCNCPDATKGNHCKHIVRTLDHYVYVATIDMQLFIFLKVLQVTQASTYWYQKALLTSELETIFSEAPLAPNSVAHPRIREAHARATGKTTTAAASTTNRRMPGPDDDCPICYESMHGVNEKSLVFCEDCGNALHRECFQQWQASTVRDGKPLTCVWCRARWVLPASAGASGSGTKRSEGYINLADVSGISPVRDTSTYYRGPRVGHRYYGYQDYDG